MNISKYLSLVKFAHTIFALPFAMIGFTLGVINSVQSRDIYDWLLLFALVLVCMVTARNAAMGYNRYADRDIDAKNPRTAGREIPAGILSPKKVLWFIIINALVFIVAACFINRLCGVLSGVVLVILLGYSKFKRFSWACHFILGVSLGIAPVGAFLAVNGSFYVNGELYFPPMILSLIVLLWVSAFDILYSLADEEFDKENKLHSIPVKLGRKGAMILSGVLHALIIPLLVGLYFTLFNSVNYLFIAGEVFFACMLFYQHYIISPTNLKRLNAAFFTTNGIASVIFSVLTILDLVL
jgi:putative 4-hydroxybenzoate polyprenyltransferase